MSSATLSVCEEHLDALHEANDYIPKRAIRFFLENFEERIPSLIQEMDHVLEDWEESFRYGTMLPYFGMVILGALQREEGKHYFIKMGHLPTQFWDFLLDAPCFDSFPLALAELYRHVPQDLKQLIEDSTLDPSLRALALHAMVCLFGQKSLTRQEVVQYFKQKLLERKEKIPFFYDVIGTAAYALHPDEMIEELRSAHQEGFFDAESVDLAEIEEIFRLPKEQVIQNGQEIFSEDLSDLIGHFDVLEIKTNFYERNEPCPCGSGQKYKKCCG